MRHPDKIRKAETISMHTVRKKLYAQAIKDLSWHRTLLIGLDPSRNKDYSLRQLHVLLQLHDTCASYLCLDGIVCRMADSEPCHSLPINWTDNFSFLAL